MGFLILLIVIGYVLSRFDIVPSSGAGLLSKLENNVFVPALVLGTFMKDFTISRMSEAAQYLLAGTVIIALAVAFSIPVARLCHKDDYIRKIYTYGLMFSNFGFMGNAVVSALFPEVFTGYLILCIPFWIVMYGWSVPALLIPVKTDGGKLAGLKNLLNPMFVAMLIGMVLGLLELQLPSFVGSAVTTLGNCMSPIAMLLTGMTIAKIDLKATLTNGSIYLVTFIRLIIIPMACIGILLGLKQFIDIPYGVALCAVCSVAMPLGLNTVVIPSAYGKDTTVAAGMAMISHPLSGLTIPIIFFIFNMLIK